jgi:hypothetical protein
MYCWLAACGGLVLLLYAGRANKNQENFVLGWCHIHANMWYAMTRTNPSKSRFGIFCSTLQIFGGRLGIDPLPSNLFCWFHLAVYDVLPIKYDSIMKIQRNRSLISGR